MDDAIFKELGYYGNGVVICDDKGQIMGAMNKKLDFPLGAVEVEANAIEEGIMLA